MIFVGLNLNIHVNTMQADVWYPFKDMKKAKSMPKDEMTLYSTKLRTLIDNPLDLHGGNVMNMETLIKYNNLLVFITDFHDVDKLVGYMFAKVVESSVTIYEFEIFREFRHKGYARDVLTNCFSSKKLIVKNNTKEHKAFWKKFTLV